MKVVVAILVVLALACGGEHREARDIYNQGVAALEKGEYESAEKLLVEARSKAKVDPELRFRAAYDLGVAYAAHADKVKRAEEPDLAQALELAQQAASWFADASQLRKSDANTKANLAIVRARVQAIADELRKAEGTLEARLDKLIGEQRSLLDDAREAWAAIKGAGGADPLAQQGTLTHLADRERGIVAEAGVLVDIASDEIEAIGKKPDDKRDEQEKVRVIQLKNVDIYLLEARTKIAEARRKLQELAAEDGVIRAEAALTALKRAREQLLDPITVLRGVAQDEVGLLQETMFAAASDGTLKLDLKQDIPPPDQMPAWLAPSAIGERQGGLRDRVEEVRARLAAATEAQQAPVDPRAGVLDPKVAQQQKLLERVKVALPSVVEASGAMQLARDALGQGKAKVAIDHERAALVELAKAIEQFADLKQTIELAYQDQQMLLKLLAPEAAKDIPAEERANETKAALARNIARMTRLQELIADEVAQAEQQAQQAAAQPPPAPHAGSAAPDPAQVAEVQKQELEQMRQRFARAEQLRGQAATALATLTAALAANTDPMPPANDGDAKITELRKLLFSVIEHLQQLIRDQGETRDQTTVTNTEDTFAREAKLPGIVGKQTGHRELAKAISDALAAQADAAGKGPPQQGGPDPKALSAANVEVKLAQNEMSDAERTLAKARDDKTMSHSLEPGIQNQAKAIEHLEAALRLLQPPQKNKQDKQDKQDQQPKQDKQDEQRGNAGQRARDEDARRQKERRKPGAADDAEKDW